MSSFRVDDWYRLSDAIVEVHQNGAVVRIGRVDAATPDSRMLWLSPDGVETRTLLDKLEGYEVWIQPDQPIIPATTNADRPKKTSKGMPDQYPPTNYELAASPGAELHEIGHNQARRAGR